MDGDPFEYDPSLLEECALSDPLHNEDKSHACIELFQRFVKHFHGDNKPPEWDRFEPFFRNVVMVYNNNNDDDKGFVLALNAFSDRFSDELPVMKTPPPEMTELFPDAVHIGGRRRMVGARLVFLYRILANFSVQKTFNYALSGVGMKDPPIGFVPSIQDQTWKPLHGDAFDKHLNWANTQNPDGVPIVIPPPNQGRCGSCWAWTCTGTLEASVARGVAYETFLDHKEMGYEDAVRAARMRERESLIPLSVQELVNCDDKNGNMGCIAGNPVLGYFFVHNHGLTTAGVFPYVGVEPHYVCPARVMDEPVVTVENWAVVDPNHEDMMVEVVRHIGPVAVLLYAGPSFLHYHEGIYDEPDCPELPNHSVLIIGYGEEEVTTLHTDEQTQTTIEKKEVVKYWLVRNSWGEGWGDRGYVRIKRGSQGRGVCGIATGVSVAIGGKLLPSDKRTPRGNIVPGAILKGETTVGAAAEDISTSSSFGTELSVLAALGVAMVALVAVVGVLFIRRRKTQKGMDEATPHVEDHQLLSDDNVAPSYGSSAL